MAEGVTWDDPGWFFVIKERPGEPRFGLDIGDEPGVDSQGRIEVWNDFGWQDLTPPVPEGSFIRIDAQTATVRANQPLENVDDEKIVQQGEDAAIVMSKDMSSAELAYILYQVPVLVAVHASEMLPQTLRNAVADFNTTRAGLDEAARSRSSRSNARSCSPASSSSCSPSRRRACVRSRGSDSDAHQAVKAKNKPPSVRSNAARSALGAARRPTKDRVLVDFAAFADPRKQLSRAAERRAHPAVPDAARDALQDDQRRRSAPTRHQLWVRIFPDDCSIDTFDDVLSQSEIVRGAALLDRPMGGRQRGATRRRRPRARFEPRRLA